MVDKINRSSLSIQKDIEIISQVGGFNNKYKNFDIEKAKKKFAEHAVPLSLRPLCLTIYADDEPVFVEVAYQNQNWIENGKQYFLYKC